MEIRCGIKKTGDDRKRYVHMLNSTLCATGRAICCLLENYQEEDGVRVPEVLVPFMGGVTFLPFVRELKDKSLRDSKKPAPKPKLSAAETQPKLETPIAPPATPATSSGNAEIDALSLKIVEVGNSVRDLKASKADKAAIKAAVDELLALKARFKEVAGVDFGAEAKPADTKPESGKKPPAETKGTSVGKEAKKTEPSVPIPVTTPAPAPRANGASGSLWKAEGREVDLEGLDAKLVSCSYVSGFVPTAADSAVFAALVNSRVVENDLKANAQRWYRHMSSFSPAERAAWK